MAAKKRRLTKQLPATQVFRLAKGLTKEEAYRQMKKRARRDFRGFNYNPNTGRGELI